MGSRLDGLSVMGAIAIIIVALVLGFCMVGLTVYLGYVAYLAFVAGNLGTAWFWATLALFISSAGSAGARR